MLKNRREKKKGLDRSKNKGRKSTNEYTQACSVAVTTRRLIASSHKTAYLINNTQTQTVESTEHSISPQATVIYMGFQESKTHQNTDRTDMCPYAYPCVPVVKNIK